MEGLLSTGPTPSSLFLNYLNLIYLFINFILQIYEIIYLFFVFIFFPGRAAAAPDRPHLRDVAHQQPASRRRHRSRRESAGKGVRQQEIQLIQVKHGGSCF